MLLASIYTSVLTRILAAMIIVLVVSQYSEPSSTITGTDFGGAGAVDVVDGSKFKASTDDIIAPAPLVIVVLEISFRSELPVAAPVVLATPSHQRLILRL